MRFMRRSVRQVSAEWIVEEKQEADFEAQEGEDDVWTGVGTVAGKIILLRKWHACKKSEQNQDGVVIIAISAKRIEDSGLKCWWLPACKAQRIPMLSTQTRHFPSSDQTHLCSKGTGRRRGPRAASPGRRAPGSPACWGALDHLGMSKRLGETSWLTVHVGSDRP